MIKNIFSAWLFATALLLCGGNQVRNGGFEQLRNGKPVLGAWLLDNPTGQNFYTFDSANRNSGKYAIKISIPAEHKKYYSIRQRVKFPVPVAAPARLKFSMRCSAAGLKSAAVILRGDSKTKVQAVWQRVAILRGDFDWKTVSAEFELPPDMINMEVAIRVYDTGILWVDDVSLDTETVGGGVDASEVGFDGKLSGATGLPGKWNEKKYHGNENVSTIAIARENGKAVAVQKYTTGAPRSGFTSPVPEKFLKLKHLNLSGSFRNLASGGVQAGFEFFDVNGVSIGELLSPVMMSDKWQDYSFNYTVPENAATVAVILLNTGRAEARFSGVRIAPGSSSKALKMADPAISVKVMPVCYSIEQQGVKTPEFNTFTNSPTKLTFHFYGYRKRMKNPTLYIDLPAGVRIADAICPHPGRFTQEPFSVTEIKRREGTYFRYKFVDVNGMQIATPKPTYQRRMVVLMMPEVPGTVFNGKKVFYHLENDGVKFKEESFDLNMLPALAKTPNPEDFPFLRWNDEDVSWFNEDAFIASLLCQEEANYTWVSRYPIRSNRKNLSMQHLASRREIMKKRNWHFVTRHVANLWTDYFVYDTGKRWDREASRALMSNGKKHVRYFCPTLITMDRDFAALRDRVIAERIMDCNPERGEFVMADNEQWGPMDWCFCDRCRSEFARRQTLKTIPDAGTIRKKYPEAWRDFRLEHERLLIENIGRFTRKQGFIFGDYNYIIDYDNPNYRDRFFSVAKDARLNEAWQDFHLASYYHTIDAKGFDMMAAGVKNLKKDYIPMMAIDGPGYLSRAVVLNPAQCRLMILSAAVTGCRGVGIYPGERMDAKFYIAADKAMAEIAVLEDFFRKGRVVSGDEVKALPFSSTVIANGKKQMVIEMPRWQEFFRSNVREFNGKKLISMLNFNAERTAYVRVRLQKPLKEAAVAEYSTGQKISLPAGTGEFLVAVPPRDARFIVIGGSVPANFTAAPAQDGIRRQFETEKKRFNTASAPLPAWKKGDFEFSYSDIDGNGIPEAVIANRDLAVTIDSANGCIVNIKFKGRELFVPGKLTGFIAEPTLWMPEKYRRNAMFKKVELVSVKQQGKAIVAEQRFSGSPLPLEITRIYSIGENSQMLSIRTFYRNTGKTPLKITPWLRSVFTAANADCRNRIEGTAKGKMIVLPRTATNSKAVFPLRATLASAPRGGSEIYQLDLPRLWQRFNALKLQLVWLLDKKSAVAAYFYTENNTSTVEWHHADLTIAPGKRELTSDILKITAF